MKACCLTDFTPTFSRELKMCDWSKLMSANLMKAKKWRKLTKQKRQKMKKNDKIQKVKEKG